MKSTRDDIDALTERLGRTPRAEFEVVVRDSSDAPVVVRNAPFTRDGTPMPTRYWLVDPDLTVRISRIEAAGGVRDAQAGVDPEELRAAHLAYARERDAAIPLDRGRPWPAGGVGGTREGVKCLHAHYANLLAGADDPVGRWTADRLASDGTAAGEAAGEELG